MANKNVKKRNWAFVVYPESAPSNWVEILAKTGLKCAISPLHDRDLNPTGEPKKPHWHVIACWEGPTSFNVVKGLTEQFNAPIPQALEQIRGYYRYLSHLDNPEKAQYNENEIQTVNGFSILDYTDLTKSETFAIKSRVLDMVRAMNIVEYSELVDFLSENESTVELEIVYNNTLFFDRYLTSRRHKLMPPGQAEN